MEWFILDLQKLNNLIELGEDDPSFFKGLIQTFLKTLESHILLIGSAVESKNAETLTMSAHALKSSCYNLGAQKLGDICQELETAGKSTKLDNISTLFKLFQQEAIEVRQEMEARPELKGIWSESQETES